MNTHVKTAARGTMPVVMAIGGMDPTGRAGLAADIRAGEAAGVHVAPVLATLTVQNARGLYDLRPAGPLFIRRQMLAVVEDLPVRAIKTGMLADAASLEIIGTVLEQLGRPLPLVVDPVLGATPGGRGVRGALSGFRRQLRRLCRHAWLLTPNLPEAAALLGELPAGNERQLREQARALRARYGCAVLLKGGHLGGEGPVMDVLVTESDEQVFIGPRRPPPVPRATGCTLATLIAARLATGEALPDAVREGRSRLLAAMAAVPSLEGAGADPVRPLAVPLAGEETDPQSTKGEA
jgi:hydroxymethylpyrimidine/phosphomethylpyrimidine kinase